MSALDCDYAEADWYCDRPAGHDGPHGMDVARRSDNAAPYAGSAEVGGAELLRLEPRRSRSRTSVCRPAMHLAQPSDAPTGTERIEVYHRTSYTGMATVMLARPRRCITIHQADYDHVPTSDDEREALRGAWNWREWVTTHRTPEDDDR